MSEIKGLEIDWTPLGCADNCGFCSGELCWQCHPRVKCTCGILERHTPPSERAHRPQEASPEWEQRVEGHEEGEAAVLDPLEAIERVLRHLVSAEHSGVTHEQAIWYAGKLVGIIESALIPPEASEAPVSGAGEAMREVLSELRSRADKFRGLQADYAKQELDSCMDHAAGRAGAYILAARLVEAALTPPVEAAVGDEAEKWVEGELCDYVDPAEDAFNRASEFAQEAFKAGAAWQARASLSGKEGR